MDLNKKKRNSDLASYYLALELLQFHEYFFNDDISELLEMHCKHLESSKSEQSIAQDLSKHDWKQTEGFLHLSPLRSLLWLVFGACAVGMLGSLLCVH